MPFLNRCVTFARATTPETLKTTSVDSTGAAAHGSLTARRIRKLPLVASSGRGAAAPAGPGAAGTSGAKGSAGGCGAPIAMAASVKTSPNTTARRKARLTRNASSFATSRHPGRVTAAVCVTPVAMSLPPPPT